MSAASETPKCKATQEALLGENSDLRLNSDCPVCLALNIRCPIGCHPSSAVMSWSNHFSPGLCELCTVTFKTSRHKTEKVEMAVSTIALSSLRDSVREKFSDFVVTAFTLRWDDANGARIDSDANIVLHLASYGHDLVVFIEIDCKSFSQFTIEDALTYAGATGVTPIIDDQKFLPAGYDDDDVTIKPLLDDAFREIMARIPVLWIARRTNQLFESSSRQYCWRLLG